MLDLTQAILNLGFLAGAFTLGYAADRYGRIVIYLISCLGVGVTGVVVAFAPNFPVLVVFRFLQGVFGKGTWMTCYVIVTEIVGSKQRRIVGIVIQMFFTLGIIILPGIAYFIPNWQGIQLAITLPNFLFLLYYWAVPESPRWLVTRKKGDRALKILRSIAKCNGKYLSPNYTEFDLVCDNAWMLDLTQAILNLGFLAGAFTLGYAADRYGRIVIYLISCLGVGVTGVVVAFAPNFPVLVVFRFLQGVFGKGTWMTCYVIVTEIVGSKQRRIVGIVIQMFFTLGIIILPGIAYFIPNWQGIQLAITLPNFLFLLYYWAVPESPRWLVTRKKGDRALKILRSIAKCNGKYLSPNYTEITVTDEEVSNPSFLDLVRTRQMRKCTLILMFAWFTSAVVYQGLVMRLGIIGGNLYIDFFISGVVELPGALLILLTIERFGRRLPFAASNIVAGVACLVTAFLPEGIPWLRTAVATLGRLGITMAFEIVYLVNSELYPTTLRNFGVSLCSGLCDFGGIIAPFLLFRLAAIWLELPLIIFGILASVCGGLVMLLPETKGIALPETVDDVEKLESPYSCKCGRKNTTQVSGSHL